MLNSTFCCIMIRNEKPSNTSVISWEDVNSDERLATWFVISFEYVSSFRAPAGFLSSQIFLGGG